MCKLYPIKRHENQNKLNQTDSTYMANTTLISYACPLLKMCQVSTQNILRVLEIAMISQSTAKPAKCVFGIPFDSCISDLSVLLASAVTLVKGNGNGQRKWTQHLIKPINRQQYTEL